MSTPNPIQTEAGQYLTTEFGIALITESSAFGLIGDFTSSIPYVNLITSEHNQQPEFMALVAVLTAALGDCTAVVKSLVPAFNLNSAVGAQQDIIGQWVGQTRVISNILITGFFGFSELSSGLPDGAQLPFGELTNQSKGGIWLELGEAATGSTVLSDPAYLTILKARIVRNQSNGTLGAIENALQFIFGAACSVTDNGTLSLALHVATPLTPVEQSLLQNLDILPRPAGVAIGSITFG